jgi:hypothetical protein
MGIAVPVYAVLSGTVMKEVDVPTDAGVKRRSRRGGESRETL